MNDARHAAVPRSGRHCAQRSGRWLIAAAAALVVFAGLGAYLLAIDDHGEEARAVATPLSTEELPSRDTDPRPLTVDEVFVDLPLIGSETLQDCARAVTGELVYLVGEAGCSQAVRGTFKTRGYVVTAGLINLVDAAAARDVHERIGSLVDAGEGGFRGLPAGAGTAPVGRAGTQFGWHGRGHYLAYAVIARGDGAPVAADDPGAAEVLEDVVEGHLRGRVLDARARA